MNISKETLIVQLFDRKIKEREKRSIVDDRGKPATEATVHYGDLNGLRSSKLKEYTIAWTQTLR